MDFELIGGDVRRSIGKIRAEAENITRSWYQEAEMPMKKPPHPGDLIKTEVIEALGLSVSKAAEILQVRRATLSDLLHGKAALTPEMALRIEKAFGPDMDHLLRMQLAYDVAKTRAYARGISIKRYAPA
jgi:addiction module HigA family antidote